MRKNHTRPAGQRSRQQKPQPQRPGYLLRHSNSGNSQAKADRAAAGSLFPRRRRKHRLPPGRILFCLRSDRRHRQLCKKLPLELRFRRPAERRTPPNRGGFQSVCRRTVYRGKRQRRFPQPTSDPHFRRFARFFAGRVRHRHL